ncbi:Excinuclease ABC subunit C [Thermodesulforhabdus norvegica]|uniref:Excinuclease ABC subunit C n=2 Tax=Thermodesulforhabdus norvegica TaxID=39841 RepID=A0A1I4QQX4_9BACT|nr:Excinuclease ABC subunit C [Thermodesulforhabdus norvegica]
MAKAKFLEFIATADEYDALIMESQFIKKFRPPYNVVLRDDKNYPSLRIDPSEDFPRLEVVRRVKRDGALYFGPYTSASTLKEAIRTLRKAFPLRICRSGKPPIRSRPCLNHDMGLCSGPCCGLIAREAYRSIVNELIQFLTGKADRVRLELELRMKEAAEQLDFERAALYRDRLKAVEAITQKQYVVGRSTVDLDVLGIWNEDASFHVTVVFVRQGIITGQKNLDISNAQGTTEEIIGSFIRQYYTGTSFIPDEIIVPVNLDDRDSLESFLGNLRGKKVNIGRAVKGYRKELLELAQKNAREHALAKLKTLEHRQSALSKLTELFGLSKLPRLIACVDISTLFGRHTVGGIVVFRDGLPDPSLYRAYDLDNTSLQGDPAMMAYTLKRFREEEPLIFGSLDLLVLDGGKGQLSAVLDLIKTFPEASPPVIALAKEKTGDSRNERLLLEKVYVPGLSEPISLEKEPEVLRLLQLLRDEAHKFALTNYRKKHRSFLTHSVLDSIPGIGPKRKALLLRHFGDVNLIRDAELDDLLTVPGLPTSLARRIYDFFHSLSR